MALEFLKIYEDMENYFGAYSQEEKGNLLDAMMAYAFRGEDAEFSGNERFIWAVLKRHIDQCAVNAEKNRINGALGGRPASDKTSDKQTNPSDKQTKPNKSKQNRRKPKETQQNPTEPTETLQEQEHIQEQEQLEEQEQVCMQKQEEGEGIREGAGSTTTPEHSDVFGLSADEMSGLIETNDRVEKLVRRCMPPWSDVKHQRVLEDVEKHGIEKVEAAMIKSAEDTKGPNSLPFYRRVLESLGTPKPTGAAHGYQTRSYSAAEFSGMETDLDAIFDDGRKTG